MGGAAGWIRTITSLSGQGILSPSRLPFRHGGNANIVHGNVLQLVIPDFYIT